MITRHKKKNGKYRFDIHGYGLSEDDALYELTWEELCQLHRELEVEIMDTDPRLDDFIGGRNGRL